MALTKILKSSGTPTNITKNAAIRPSFRLLEYQHIKVIRLLENGGKRLLENSATDSTDISKSSGALTKMSKNLETMIKISKGSGSLTKINKS